MGFLGRQRGDVSYDCQHSAGHAGLHLVHVPAALQSSKTSRYLGALWHWRRAAVLCGESALADRGAIEAQLSILLSELYGVDCDSLLFDHVDETFDAYRTRLAGGALGVCRSTDTIRFDGCVW